MQTDNIILNQMHLGKNFFNFIETATIFSETVNKTEFENKMNDYKVIKSLDSNIMPRELRQSNKHQELPPNQMDMDGIHKEDNER